VLRADRAAYLNTWEAATTPPPTLTETLQLPFTAFRQEVVLLDVAGDGQSAQGVVVVHAQVDGAEFPEEGRLLAVTFVLQEGEWRMASRERTGPDLRFPPP